MPRGRIYAPKTLGIHARAGEVGVAVVLRSYSRAAASRTSSSSGFSPAHSIISLQNSSAASIFSEQTERKLILLLDATLLGTRLKPCPPIARVLGLNRLYSSSNGNTRFRKPQALSSVFAALSRYSPGPSAF